MPLYDLRSVALSFSVTAALIAILTALILNATYALGLRATFNRILVNRWLQKAHSAVQQLISRVSLTNPEIAQSELRGYGDVPISHAFAELVRLAGAGNSQGLFSLDYAQLSGQVGDAIQANLESSYDATLIVYFAPTADPQDLKFLHSPRHVTNVDKKVDEQKSELIAARQRVLAHAQRGLDSLQSWLSAWWVRLDYLMAFFVAGFLVAGFDRAGADPNARRSTVDVANILLLALVSALLVPIVAKLAERIGRTAA